MSYRDIITIEPDKRGGKPCIRQTRITAYEVLAWLAAGMSIADIMDDFPELTETDIRACLEFAADRDQCHSANAKGNEQPSTPTPKKLKPDYSETLIDSQQRLQETEQPPLKSKLYSIVQPFTQMEKRIWEPILSWGENQALLSLLGLLGNLGLIFAALTYIGLEEQRRESQVYLAWQTITNAQGQSGNGGRILALEFLNASPGANWRLHFPWICVSEDWLCSKWEAESLDGVDLAKAYLAKVRLPRASLVEANLQGAVLWQANLQGARLLEANLQGARLGGANLQGAKLDGANLQGAFYSDAKTPKNICLDITSSPAYPCPTRFPDGFDPKASGMKLLR
ncbi:MAG: DUF433 domain-containing protein [Microcoleaceae cyanobacterium]